MTRHAIPAGWERGEPLIWINGGPRYAAMRNVPLEPAQGATSEIGAVEFNSFNEAKAFDEWWKEGRS